mmetsp:Transcript_91869/g.162634  ORF Transcript_91869/g.162634 Transcript_91869/m.162634 type:complete len:228 (+) Transcript_91869:1642-2325(+)
MMQDPCFPILGKQTRCSPWLLQPERHRGVHQFRHSRRTRIRLSLTLHRLQQRGRLAACRRRTSPRMVLQNQWPADSRLLRPWTGHPEQRGSHQPSPHCLAQYPQVLEQVRRTRRSWVILPKLTSLRMCLPHTGQTTVRGPAALSTKLVLMVPRVPRCTALRLTVLAQLVTPPVVQGTHRVEVRRTIIRCPASTSLRIKLILVLELERAHLLQRHQATTVRRRQRTHL